MVTDRVKRLFELALGIPAEQRELFLGELELPVRQEVESLLASHDEADSFLEEPPPVDAVTITIHNDVDVDDRQIGPYRVLGEIGHGGMGVVYEAEQVKPVQRRVALKLIKWGMDTRAVIARFESERQALALMNHPNIASVYDAGSTEEGRPYFAMEYVQGIPITEYCDKHRLTIKERLELFIQVAEGVQHAHQKGIIHRDLKPSNVLVAIQDNRPVPKVIDFGVAKATSRRLTERTVDTELGQLIGTPEYMSPEQAEMTNLDIDTRTDVYSLGVVLYELLVGAQPFDPRELRKAGLVEIQRKLREEEPPRPSTRVGSLGEASTTSASNRQIEVRALEKILQGDLDWVTMKALEKDRTRRYGSANELTTDVQRYLSNQPVRARPPSMTYTLGKFVRRNRVIVTAAGLVLAALVVGLTAAAVGFFHASQERDAAERARDESEAVTEFLASMLAAADPAELGKDVTVRQVLDQAAGSIGEEFGGQPLIEARLRGTIGETYHALGLYKEAEEHARRQLEIQRALHPEEHPDRLMATQDLAILYRKQGRLDEAEPLIVKTLDLSRRALGEDDPQTLNAMGNLAALYVAQGRLQEAEALFVESLELRREAMGEEHDSTLTNMNNLGSLYKELGRYDEAEALLAKTVEIHRRVLGDEHPDTLPSMSNLASLYTMLGRYQEAESLYVTALEICRRLLGEEHPHTLTTMSNLAGLYSDQGQYADAGNLYNEALKIQRRVLGVEHSKTLTSMTNLAVLYARQEQYADSESLLVEALGDPAPCPRCGAPQYTIHRKYSCRNAQPH